MLRIATTLFALTGAALAGAAMAGAPGPMTEEPTSAAQPQAKAMTPSSSAPQAPAASAPAPQAPAASSTSAPAPQAPAAPSTAAAPASGSLTGELRRMGPPAVTPRFNDVMTAVIYGDQATVAQLLDLGRWVDKPDSNGLTPLMVAVDLRDEGMVRLLLERGADPNLEAPGGEVALEMAQANGEGGIEQLLRRAGASY